MRSREPTSIDEPAEEVVLSPPSAAVRGRWRSVVLLALGLAAMVQAVALIAGRSRPSTYSITLTPGPLATSRALVAGAIVDAVKARGHDARLVETSRTGEEIEQVDVGRVDFALVSAAYPMGQRRHLREVTPLYVEALHLLVKDEMADAVGRSLGALGGRTIGFGPSASTSTGLATAALAFAGVLPGDARGGRGYLARHLDLDRLEALIARGDREALPDAVVHLDTVPSTVAVQLVRSAGYELVALPFAEAFRLNSLLTGAAPDTSAHIERRFVSDAVIPAFTYRIDPAVPGVPLHTLGSHLILIAHDQVPPAVVQLVLDTVFSSEVARITHPALEPVVLAEPPHLRRHDGTLEYVARDRPYITQDAVDRLSGSVSIIGALGGGTIFLWQWWRQRTRRSQEETFRTYLLRIADVERRLATHELSPSLDLEALAELQREALRLKSDALERFAAGDLGGQAALSDLLLPLNAVRDQLGDLILHVRGQLEQQADAEGRTSAAVWAEAVDEPEGSGGKG